MPEGPEVRKNVDFIRNNFLNQILHQVEIIGGRYKKKSFFGFNNLQDLSLSQNLKLKDIQNKGKLIYFIFESDKKEYYLISHLGMGGIWVKNSFNPPHHIHVEFTFKDSDNKSNKLLYVDLRHFGTLRFLENKKDFQDILDKLGPDIYSISKTDFISIFENEIQKEKKKKLSKVLIGHFLMKQEIISGIGNYLRADSLYLSKISPYRRLIDLDFLHPNNEIEKLFYSLKMMYFLNYNLNLLPISKTSIHSLFSNDSNFSHNFSHKYKNKNKFILILHDHEIYMKKHDYLGNPVKREKMGTRTIHWVPSIQS